MELVKEHTSYKDADAHRPGKRGLTEDEIQRIHDVFIETGGYVRKTARHTGFGRSTVSRYAKARGWREEIGKVVVNQKAECRDSHDNLAPASQAVTPEDTHLQSSSPGEIHIHAPSSEPPISQESQPHIHPSFKNGANGCSKAEVQSDEDKPRATAKLKKMRQLLFHEIIADETIEAHHESDLKILPRTLSEAVKALIDIDKRISEREGSRSDTMLESYLRILERCAKTAKE